MIYSHILRMADAPNGGGATPPPIEVAGDGDMASAMVAEMEKVSGGQPPAPAAAPAPAAPAPAPAAKPPEPAAPAAKAPAPAPAAKPAAQPAKPAAPAAAKPGAPAAEPQLDWKTAPAQFRAAHEKLVQVHQQETARLSTELQQATSKMRDLEGKKFLSPEQEQKYAKLEQEQQRLAAELYARDYEQSPEFKQKFESRAVQVYNEMDAELKGMMVNGEDGNQRPATRGDFQKVVMAAFQSKTAAIKAAKELFSEDDAQVILDGAKSLAAIQKEGQAAIDAKRSGYQSEREKQAQTLEQTRQSANQNFTQYDGLLEKTFPQYFGPIEGNDQYNKAREEGLNFVDSVIREIKNDGSPRDIQQSALIRRWAAAFPAAQVLLKQRGDEIAALQATIAKLKGSDPGALGDGGGTGGGGGEEAGGTDELARQIDEITRQG